MLDFLANPYAPCGVLLLIAGLAIGFRWGARSEGDRIGDDLDMLGRTRIRGEWLFEGRCVGHADDADDEWEDGDPQTVEDLLNGHERKDAH